MAGALETRCVLFVEFASTTTGGSCRTAALLQNGSLLCPELRYRSRLSVCRAALYQGLRRVLDALTGRVSDRVSRATTWPSSSKTAATVGAGQASICGQRGRVSAPNGMSGSHVSTNRHRKPPGDGAMRRSDVAKIVVLMWCLAMSCLALSQAAFIVWLNDEKIEKGNLWDSRWMN